MKIFLLRVGVDIGTDRIHGPLFEDGTFEYIPIHDDRALPDKKYGDTVGRHGRMLVDFFPQGRRETMSEKCIHDDPEFETFTYGEPNSPKNTILSCLGPGDMLVFYCGLQKYNSRLGQYDSSSRPALYPMGYFEVSEARFAKELSRGHLHEVFGKNFHVRNQSVLDEDCESLLVVKGGNGSKLLEKAKKEISEEDKNSIGRPLDVLSREMRQVFGDLGGKNSLQRSTPPRRIPDEFVNRAAEYVRSLDC